MVHITGDTHGEIDSHKLTVKNFPQQKLMTKSDSLIVCGDFGCVGWIKKRQIPAEVV